MASLKLARKVEEKEFHFTFTIFHIGEYSIREDYQNIDIYEQQHGQY